LQHQDTKLSEYEVRQRIPYKYLSAQKHRGNWSGSLAALLVILCSLQAKLQLLVAA